MGSSSSKTKAPRPVKPATVDHGPLPFEASPYQGPIVQYRIVQMNVSLRPEVSFGFSRVSQTTTNVDDYYPTLGGQYGEGFILLSFYRIPGGSRRQGMFSMSVSVPFQGLFYRYPTVPTEERWQLRIEKSIMYVHAMTTCRIFAGSTSQSSADTSHLINTISGCASQGGRLICVELTGTNTTQATQMGFTSAGAMAGMGVDLFFNMPLHPNPTQYIYQAVNAPIPMTMQAGLGQVMMDIQFDFLAQLSAYLNQGFRLVEVFYDYSQSMQAQGAMMARAGLSINSIWFFEKEAARANDPTPVYEGCIVEYYLKISADFGGTSAAANWAPLLDQMGSKGWELACVLETPKMVRSGMMTFKQTVLMFFQRRIQYGMQPPQGSPVGMVDPATGQPLAAPQPVMPPPPPSYNQATKQ